jgi:hypothetical protein
MLTFAAKFKGIKQLARADSALRAEELREILKEESTLHVRNDLSPRGPEDDKVSLQLSRDELESLLDRSELGLKLAASKTATDKFRIAASDSGGDLNNALTR